MDLLERKITNGNRHPWELSRTECLINTFLDVVESRQELNVANIGAGDRFFDEELLKTLRKNNQTAKIFSVDVNYPKDEIASENIVLKIDVSELEDNSMDCIFMMDVLEHVENDKDFYRLVCQKLKIGGMMIVTVPAFQSLFSVHDEFLRHYRRYDYETLKRTIVGSSTTICSSHYFYTCLAIVRWLQLRFNTLSISEEKGIAQWAYNDSSLITKSIKSVLNMDFYINKLLANFGIRLPGLSLLATLEKSQIDHLRSDIN